MKTVHKITIVVAAVFILYVGPFLIMLALGKVQSSLTYERVVDEWQQKTDATVGASPFLNATYSPLLWMVKQRPSEEEERAASGGAGGYVGDLY